LFTVIAYRIGEDPLMSPVDDGLTFLFIHEAFFDTLPDPEDDEDVELTGFLRRYKIPLRESNTNEQEPRSINYAMVGRGPY